MQSTLSLKSMSPALTTHWRRFSRRAATGVALLLPLLFIFMLLPLRAEAVFSPIHLDRVTQYDLSGHLESYTDPSGKLTITDILKPTTSAQFLPLKSNLSRGYTEDTIWVRFTLTRSASFPETGWLRLYPAYLDYVDVYVQTGTNPSLPSSYRKIALGDHVPIVERPMQHPEFVTPIYLSELHPTTLYIRIRSTSTLTLAGAIHTPADFLNWTNMSVMLNSSYLAVSLLITLVNIIFFLHLKDKVYLFFALASERLALEQQHSFLAMLSHEYRTPLSVIQGNLEITKTQ